MSDGHVSGGADGAADGRGRLLWELGLEVYLPTFLLSFATGALLPLLPGIALAMGTDLGGAAILASVLVVGQLLGSIPSGWVVGVVGERRTMLFAEALATSGVTIVLLATDTVVLSVGLAIVGLCGASFGLARHAYLSIRIPQGRRGRGLALLGGVSRSGLLVGPLASGALVLLTDGLRPGVWLFAGCHAAILLVLVFAAIRRGRRNGSRATVLAIPPARSTSRIGFAQVLRDSRWVLVRLGFAAAVISGVRAARTVLLPLWGVALGIDVGTVALLVGVANAGDFALFYTSGQIMDRFGRFWASFPPLVVMSACFLLLASTIGGADAVGWFITLTMVLGLSNGVSSGILLTLGADLAPPHAPGPFLGVWRATSDLGGAGAPLLIALLTSAFSLAVAAMSIGVLGLLGAAALWRWVPRRSS